MIEEKDKKSCENWSRHRRRARSDFDEHCEVERNSRRRRGG